MLELKEIGRSLIFYTTLTVSLQGRLWLQDQEDDANLISTEV